MATNGHDRAHLLPFENGSKWDDRYILNQNGNTIWLMDDRGLALTYALGVSLFLFFVKIRYKMKKLVEK